MQTDDLATYIRRLLAEGNEWKFYKSREWLALRDEVLREGHYECARCLEHGRYTRAVMVHHVNEVRKRPDMALTKTYVDDEGQERKNLIPLCFACHEKEHDRFDAFRTEKQKERFVNEERWE